MCEVLLRYNIEVVTQRHQLASTRIYIFSQTFLLFAITSWCTWAAVCCNICCN